MDADVIVLDEASMVDTQLFSDLLRGTKPGSRVVIVGDVDQLPSIGPGRVLYDLLQASTVPSTHLTEIFRQASESPIPHLARALNNGESPDFNYPDGQSVRGLTRAAQFIELGHESHVAEIITRLVADDLQAKGLALQDIQVLCPQRKGLIGVEALNERIQLAVNLMEWKQRVPINGGIYSAGVGDRVIHTRNNYTLEVMNGEIGHITLCKFNGLDTMPYDCENHVAKPWAVVDFGDRRVAYSKQDLLQLHLAYAITVHKSQGSEFPCVVMPIHDTNQFMLTRPLTYTAITRASEAFIGVGQQHALNAAALNQRGIDRRTRLQELLQC